MSSRVSDTELERSKKAREISQNWLAAEQNRLELARLDPMVDGGALPEIQRRTGKYGRPSPVDRVEEARVRGLELSAFEKGLTPDSVSKPAQVSPATLVEQKALIIRALAANHTAEEIEKYLQRLGPYLDLAAMAGVDPMAQGLLYARVMGSGEPSNSLGLKDVIQVINLVNNMKGQPQQQNDPAAMVTAMGSVFAAAFAAAQQNNNKSDPALAFQAGMQAISPVLERQNETTKMLMQNQLDTLRLQLEKSEKNTDPFERLRKTHELAQSFGWTGGGEESDDIKKEKLAMDKENSQRAFELERIKWEKEWAAKQETAKQKAQAELLGGITGTLGKVFESPVVRELGKNVGSRLGNPLAKAQTAAAQNQLANPTETPYQFRCAKCNTLHTFSSKELTLLAEKGGRWVCSTANCGAPYQLGGPFSDKLPGGEKP